MFSFKKLVSCTSAQFNVLNFVLFKNKYKYFLYQMYNIHDGVKKNLNTAPIIHRELIKL